MTRVSISCLAVALLAATTAVVNSQQSCPSDDMPADSTCPRTYVSNGVKKCLLWWSVCDTVTACDQEKIEWFRPWTAEGKAQAPIARCFQGCKQIAWQDGRPRCLLHDSDEESSCVAVHYSTASGTAEVSCLPDVCGRSRPPTCARRAYCPLEDVYCFDSCTVDRVSWVNGVPTCDDGKSPCRNPLTGTVVKPPSCGGGTKENPMPFEPAETPIPVTCSQVNHAMARVVPRLSDDDVWDLEQTPVRVVDWSSYDAVHYSPADISYGGWDVELWLQPGQADYVMFNMVGSSRLLLIQTPVADVTCAVILQAARDATMAEVMPGSTLGDKYGVPLTTPSMLVRTNSGSFFLIGWQPDTNNYRVVEVSPSTGSTMQCTVLEGLRVMNWHFVCYGFCLIWHLCDMAFV